MYLFFNECYDHWRQQKIFLKRTDSLKLKAVAMAMMSINILLSYNQAGVVGVSISLMDGNTGPFHLEIKDIGLHNDPTADDEKFAYEMYKLPDFWAGY